MADNVQLNAGSGGQILRADDVGGFLYQWNKLAFGADGVATLVEATAGLPVHQQTGATWTVTGAVTQSGTWNITNISGTISLPTGAATAAKQPALGTAGTASADVISIQGIALMTPIQIADNGGSITVDGTVAATQSGTWNVGTVTTLTSLSQFAGNAIDLNNGAAGVGTLRVTVANDSTGILAGVTTVSTLTTLSQFGGQAINLGNGAVGTGTLRVTLGNDSTGILASVTTVGTVTTLSQFGGQAINLGNGTVGTGTLRVTLASDSTGVVGLATGTNTVGNVGLAPRTSGGLDTSRLISAATTNATNVKASAGQLYGLIVFNLNAAARYLKLYDKATSPTIGTDTPKLTIMIPPNSSGVVSHWEQGIAFSLGIGFGLTTGIADSDTAAVAANEIGVNVMYK